MLGFCVINTRVIKIVNYSPFFIQVQGIFLLKILNEMRAVICINLHFLLLPFLCIPATLSLGSDGRSSISDANFIPCNSMLLRTPQTVVRIGEKENCELQHIKEEMG